MFYSYVCYTEKNEYVRNFFKSVIPDYVLLRPEGGMWGYVCTVYGLNFFTLFCAVRNK
jgi:hypothetical protein